MEWIILPIFYLLYWGMCVLLTGSDKKNLLSFFSYPEEVRKIVKENDGLKDYIPKKRPLIVTLLSNIVIFTLVFFLIGVLINKVFLVKGFAPLLTYFLVFGEGLNLFDLRVIDLIWWRNSKRVRFSFLMDKKAYQDPKEHAYSFLRAIPSFAVIALLSAFFSSLL